MRGSGKWGIYKAHSTTGDWREARIRKYVSKRQPEQEVGLRAEERRPAFFCFIPANDNLESTLYKWSKFHSQIYLEEAIQTSEMKENIGDRIFFQYSVQFSSAAPLCPTLCDPMNCSTPGLPDHHQLPEPNQTHVHWVDDAIQPSQPLFSPSPPALNLSQHQGLFHWVSSSHQVAKVLGVSASTSVLPMNTQDWSLFAWTGWISLQSKGLSRVFSNTTVQKHQFFGAQPSL